MFWDGKFKVQPCTGLLKKAMLIGFNEMKEMEV